MPAVDPVPSPTLPRSLRRRLVFGLAAGVFLVRLVYYVFNDVAEGGERVPNRIFEEVTGILTALPLIWLTLVTVERRRLLEAPWRRVVPWVAALFVGFSLLHTTLMIAVRGALGPPLGLGDYRETAFAARYTYELANEVLPFAVFAAALALAEYAFRLRERERREAALERSLLEAELRSLRLQLQPHFLFNALNTVSSTMYEDPAAADALLVQLSELLRTSLRTTHVHEQPLGDEVQLLEQYLALMRARFGDALDVRVDVGADARAGLVPSMVLQPLVENAVRHGRLAHEGAGVVTVTARRLDAPPRLELRVHDDGPGLAPGVDPLVGGTGLQATRQRLALLYGDAAAMSAGTAPGGGFAVVLVLPWRTAADASGANVAAARVPA